MGVPRNGAVEVLHIVYRARPPQDWHRALHEPVGRATRHGRLQPDGHRTEASAVLEETRGAS